MAAEDRMVCGLVYYRGAWEAPELETVTEAIRQTEAQFGSPFSSSITPWVAVRMAAGHGLIYYIAHRMGFAEPIVAQTATDLVQLIQALA